MDKKLTEIVANFTATVRKHPHGVTIVTMWMMFGVIAPIFAKSFATAYPGLAGVALIVIGIAMTMYTKSISADSKKKAVTKTTGHSVQDRSVQNHSAEKKSVTVTEHQNT